MDGGDLGAVGVGVCSGSRVWAGGPSPALGYLAEQPGGTWDGSVNAVVRLWQVVSCGCCVGR